MKSKPEHEIKHEEIAASVSARPAVITVREHFKDAADILYVMTDGILNRNNSSLRKYKHWDELSAAAFAVIGVRPNMPLKDRKDLAGLMSSTIDRMTKSYPATQERNKLFQMADEQYIPRAWFAIKHQLYRGGPIELLPGGKEPSEFVRDMRYRHRFAYAWLNVVYHAVVEELDADLEPWEQYLYKFRDDNFKGYREGWQVLHQLILKLGGDPPDVLVKVRNRLWERDAADGKPAAAPWEAIPK
jgi:hypothetical protein